MALNSKCCPAQHCKAQSDSVLSHISSITDAGIKLITVVHLELHKTVITLIQQQRR